MHLPSLWNLIKLRYKLPNSRAEWSKSPMQHNNVRRIANDEDRRNSQNSLWQTSKYESVKKYTSKH